MVTRLSADDGGPVYSPNTIEGWKGTIGQLPRQPGSQNSLFYFVLNGEVPVLYGIVAEDSDIQSKLEYFQETGTSVRI